MTRVSKERLTKKFWLITVCSEHLIQHTLEMQPFESCSIQKVTMVKVVVMVILVGHYIVLSMESLRNISNLRALSSRIVQKYKEGCVFLMVVISMLLLADIGRNDHQEGKPHFSIRDPRSIFIETNLSNLEQHHMQIAIAKN